MQTSNWSWFDLNFPWIGIVVIMLILLFGTRLLYSGQTGSRWRDISWLSWLGFTAYLIHNGEEYGNDTTDCTWYYASCSAYSVYGSVFEWQNK